ncbi:hypothetical protein ABZ901_00765 [Actinacidiphila alni]|uniref:hypothetical protein n=1 Tax=Actinacidiphila alni TaxID=380248 RepID=UPI003408A4B4
MTTTTPALADPEIAAAIFADHVVRAEASDLARNHEWVFSRLDPLHVVVRVRPAGPSADGSHYFVRLGADYYDQYPPTTLFVCPPLDPGVPAGWLPAGPGSRWLPAMVGLPWFAIHDEYQYADGVKRQLVCCSMTFEYYVTGHAPTPGQRWRQGRHTLVATLTRIQEALDGATYQGNARAVHP